MVRKIRVDKAYGLSYGLPQNCICYPSIPTTKTDTLSAIPIFHYFLCYFEENGLYMYGIKIRMIRELRGFSQEYMASELGIKQNSYSNIETNQTKLSVEMLEDIAKILGVSPVDIMSPEPAFVNFGTVQNSSIQGHIENFNNFQKEMLEGVIKTNETIIASKDAEIETLHKIIDGLLKDKEGLMEFLKTKNTH